MALNAPGGDASGSLAAGVTHASLNAVTRGGRLIGKHWLARVPLVGSVAPTQCCEARVIAVKLELPNGALALPPLTEEDRAALVISDLLILVPGDCVAEAVSSLTSLDRVSAALYEDVSLQDFGPAAVAAFPLNADVTGGKFVGACDRVESVTFVDGGGGVSSPGLGDMSELIGLPGDWANRVLRAVPCGDLVGLGVTCVLELTVDGTLDGASFQSAEEGDAFQVDDDEAARLEEEQHVAAELAWDAGRRGCPLADQLVHSGLPAAAPSGTRPPRAGVVAGAGQGPRGPRGKRASRRSQR